MPASSFCASRPRDATRRMKRDGAGLRSSFAAATPSQQRLATPSQLRRASESHLALQPSTQLVVFVASILEVLLAAARGGTRRHLEGGRALRAASAPSQQDQLHHSSRSRRRGDGSVPRPLGSPSIGQSLEKVFHRIDKLSFIRINLPITGSPRQEKVFIWPPFFQYKLAAPRKAFYLVPFFSI